MPFTGHTVVIRTQKKVWSAAQREKVFHLSSGFVHTQNGHMLTDKSVVTCHTVKKVVIYRKTKSGCLLTDKNMATSRTDKVMATSY